MESLVNKESHSFELWNSCLEQVENEDYSPEISYNSDGEILAPNGEISRMPNVLYVKVIRTPAFKQWFGDWVEGNDSSKAIYDDTEEPIVFVHRTDAPVSIEKGLSVDYAEPSYRRIPQAVYFTTVQDQADFGDTKYSVFLNIRNPSNTLKVADEMNDGCIDRFRTIVTAAVFNDKQIMHIASPVLDSNHIADTPKLGRPSK